MTWLSFLLQPVVVALPHSPLPELGVDRVPIRHAAVTELYLVFTQLSELVVPLRVTQSSIIINSFKSRCIEAYWLIVLVFALVINSSLLYALFLVCFYCHSLAHGL